MFGARLGMGRARSRTLGRACARTVARFVSQAPPNPLAQLQRLQSFVGEASATNSLLEKKGILTRYPDLVPVLER